MIKIGCCGYPINKKRYQEVFSLVEVNSTFYSYPIISTVMRWREEAREGFEFTVKAHQDLSHKHKLGMEFAREPFERMKEICRTLDAKILLIQTAASFKPDSIDEAETFFEKINRKGLTIVWETRGSLWENIGTREKLRTVLKRLDIPHVTDPFKTMPVYTSQTAYFRLHGLGERMYYYQYTNEELQKLYDRVKFFDAANKNVYVLFNNLSMFEDAKRFLSFIKHGCFPSLTGTKGLDSVREMINKIKYPTTTSMLTRKSGWRLIELEDGRQVGLEELLRDLPQRSYKNEDELLKNIEPILEEPPWKKL